MRPRIFIRGSIRPPVRNGFLFCSMSRLCEKIVGNDQEKSLKYVEMVKNTTSKCSKVQTQIVPKWPIQTHCCPNRLFFSMSQMVSNDREKSLKCVEMIRNTTSKCSKVQTQIVPKCPLQTHCCPNRLFFLNEPDGQ